METRMTRRTAFRHALPSPKRSRSGFAQAGKRAVLFFSVISVSPWSIGSIGGATPAVAAEPVALVEMLTGAPQGVGFMDYLFAGQVIALRPSEGLVIDYLQSCERETIKGAGTVTVGVERSVIEGSNVTRERVRCDGERLKFSPAEAEKSGVVVFRGAPKPNLQPGDLVIERRLYGASPIIALGSERAIHVERLDRAGEAFDVAIPPARLTAGRFYDFAADGRALAAGGVYRVTVGEHSAVVEVDSNARPGKTPLAGRLLRF